MEATVILMRCKINKGLSGIRVQKMVDGKWARTWSFKINERIAKNENFSDDLQLEGMLPTVDFPGCPYCGSKGFVICNKCKKMTCRANESVMTCSWCGNKLSNMVISTKFDLSGGDY